jgi:hypothetical protein
MAQQLISAGNAFCSGFTPGGFTPAGSVPSPLTPEEVLQALPPEASPALREALQSGCCIHYTVSEGDCGSGGCGAGWCCYHAVSTGCGINEYTCVHVPCSTGNFSSGC